MLPGARPWLCLSTDRGRPLRSARDYRLRSTSGRSLDRPLPEDFEGLGCEVADLIDLLATGRASDPVKAARRLATAYEPAAALAAHSVAALEA